MKYPSKIYQGQIYRLVLFGLLHANLVHLVSNLLSQIILGSIMEGLIGNKNAWPFIFIKLYMWRII